MLSSPQICYSLALLPFIAAVLVVTPRDTEAKLNDTTYMNCSTSLVTSVHWYHGRFYVYTGAGVLEPYNERFTVERNVSTGAYNLVIRSVQPQDAGEYKCQDDEGFGESRSANLIVLDVSSANTTTNITLGEEIACIANSSQSCTYKWKWLSGEDSVTMSTSQTLTPTRVGLHRCEATCILRDIPCTVTVMFAEVQSTVQRKETWLALLVIPVVAVISLFILIYWRKKQKRRANVVDSEVDIAANQFLDSLKKAEAFAYLERAKHLVTTDRNHLHVISGIAALSQEVFISRAQCVDIEVLDSTTLYFKRNIKVDGMISAEPIVSCSVNICLYTFVWDFMEQCNAVLRIDPSNGKLTKAWQVFGRGGRLSVANDTNVILNINYEAKLKEYTADGELIRVIDLGLGTDIFRAWHAVKLPSGLFVICQGCEEDPINRVCLLSTKATTDSMGRTDEVEIQKVEGESFTGPFYLYMNKAGLILVSDANLVLLSSNLDKPRILNPVQDGVHRFWLTCFDESAGQWFVAHANQIMVCRVEEDNVERKIYYQLQGKWVLSAIASTT